MSVFKQFRIEEDLLHRLKGSSKKLGVSASDWIRMAIIEKLKREEKK